MLFYLITIKFYDSCLTFLLVKYKILIKTKNYKIIFELSKPTKFIKLVKLSGPDNFQNVGGQQKITYLI